MSDTKTCGVCRNTDKELWRERFADYSADSIHVTESGSIGINCGGHVFVMPLRKWHEAAKAAEDVNKLRQVNTKLVCAIDLIRETLIGGEVQDLHNIINAALTEYHQAQKPSEAEAFGMDLYGGGRFPY